MLGETLYTHGMMDQEYMTEEGKAINIMIGQVMPDRSKSNYKKSVSARRQYSVTQHKRYCSQFSL